MPRTNSRKRNNQRNDITTRVPIASNLSPNAAEFIPTTNDESITVNQRECLPLQPMTFHGSTNASSSIGNNCTSNNSEAANTSTLVTLANKGQRDLLINRLNESKVDCVICYDQATNVEPIWSCRNCFQIMHLKCIMVWFLKSHTNSTWRCPACQSNVVGKPSYVCFCGALPNPFSNHVDTPHSCGQVCGLRKKNANSEFDDCHHKCTLLCHPGPCPQCAVQVLRNCGCGKTNVYVQCGQPTPILCQNKCSKILNCKNHVCEKQCHADKCEPCKEPNLQCLQMLDQARRSPERQNFHHTVIQDYVTDDELLMLGIDPDEILQRESDEFFFMDGFDDDQEDEEDLYEDEEDYYDYFNDENNEEMDYSEAPPVPDSYVPRRVEDPIGSHLQFLFNGEIISINRPVQIFGNNSVNEDSNVSSATSASNSSTNTNNSSNNTNNSSNNTNNSSNITNNSSNHINNSNNNTSNDEVDDYDSFGDSEESDYELPLDLSRYDPNRFDTSEGGYSEEERDSVLQNSQEVRRNSEFSDTSYSANSTSNSQSSIFINDTNSSSTDTTTDTSSSN